MTDQASPRRRRGLGRAFFATLRQTGRPAALALAAALGAAGAQAAPRTAAPTVTLLGDSITAGYGLPASQALPARLQAALAARGVRAQVVAAGVSGDTTADGRARADFSVPASTTLAVVALGGNDLLQGLDPKVTRANLDAIVARLQARRMRVLIAGIAAPPVIGARYARAFDQVFVGVARARHAALYQDLLAGVEGHPALLQRDGIHPNAAGADLIARRLAPVVAAALPRR